MEKSEQEIGSQQVDAVCYKAVLRALGVAVENAPMEPISVVPLSTDRLLLTPISVAHSGGVFALWSNPDVCRFSGRVVDYDDNVLDTPCTTVC